MFDHTIKIVDVQLILVKRIEARRKRRGRGKEENRCSYIIYKCNFYHE